MFTNSYQAETVVFRFHFRSALMSTNFNSLDFFPRLMFTLVYSPRSQGCVRSALPCTEINCRDAVSCRVRTTGTDVSDKELGTSHKDAGSLFIFDY